MSKISSPIMLLGGNGMLGQDISILASAIPLSKEDCDITCLDAIEHAIYTHKPSVVINCAAYTKVDLAEKESEQAHLINSLGAKNAALACLKMGVALTHISTDYVFDGKSSEPYLETDTCRPLSVYGKSKHEGERYVLEHMPKAKIVRTQWLYGHGGENFVETMIRLGKSRDQLSVIHDQVGTPTSTHDLAKAILTLCSYPAAGVFHIRNAGSTSWYGFAKEIFSQTGISCDVRPITTEEYPLPATRPQNGILSMSRWQKELSLPELPHWKSALQHYLKTRQNLKDHIQ